MLSYQHIYHAGNHADILKHIALVSLLSSMNKKEKPYTVFDTHAGSGRYDLSDERAQKTEESTSGISQLLASLALQKSSETQAENKTAFQTYISLVKASLADGFYPGSPEIERSLMRKGDCLVLSELHPQEIELLRKNMKLPSTDAFASAFASASHSACGDTFASGERGAHHRNENSPSINIHFRDGFEMLRALTPPQIKRGFVLIDPSYEETSDYTSSARAVCGVHEKWSAATIALWYPILAHRKNDLQIMRDTIIASVKTSRNPAEIVDVQLTLPEASAATHSALHATAATTQKANASATANTVAQSPTSAAQKNAHNSRLLGSGMFVVNAPWKFTEEMNSALEIVCDALDMKYAVIEN